jgi:hypothetical protein
LNERHTNEHDDDVTEEMDYPAEFISKFRLGLQRLDVALGAIERDLPKYTVAGRRAAMFRFRSLLLDLDGLVDDAVPLVSNHIEALSMKLAER